MHRQAGQLSLAEGVMAPGAGVNARLERIDRLLEWTALAVVVAPIYAAPTGRPSHPPLLMVKALLLQQGYGCPTRGSRRRSPTACRSAAASASQAELRLGAGALSAVAANAVHFQLLCLAGNLRRAEVLTRRRELPRSLFPAGTTGIRARASAPSPGRLHAARRPAAAAAPCAKVSLDGGGSG